MTTLAVILEMVRPRARAAALGALAIAVAASGWALYLSAAQASGARLEEALGRRRLGDYDILVRPSGARTELEETHGLVAPNHLNHIAGGITSAQYEAIRALPEVEVAAPIAMLGYYRLQIKVAYSGEILGPGAYVVRCTRDDGEGALARHHEEAFYYHYTDDSASLYGPEGPGGDIRATRGLLGCLFDHVVLVAGVDPAQESALLGLASAVEGRYLPAPAAPTVNSYDGSDAQPAAVESPTLINAADHLQANLAVRIARLELPHDVQGSADVAARGGGDYLQGLPEGDLVFDRAVQAGRHAGMYTNLYTSGQSKIIALGPAPLLDASSFLYRAAVTPAGGMLGPATVAVAANLADVPAGGPSAAVAQRVRIATQGTFDLDRLAALQGGLARWDTYATPAAIQRSDERDQPMEPLALRAGPQPVAYLQPPPTYLTTLAAAQALHGDEIISAVRVRLAGAGGLSPQTLAELEAVAGEIARRTGLQVDVVRGSATRPVLVHVPGLGYLEQTWIQRGVAQALLGEVDRARTRLAWPLAGLGVVLLAGGVWSLGGRQDEGYRLLRELGWPCGALGALAAGGGALVGALAAALGLLAAALGAQALGWPLPSAPAMLALPVATLAGVVGPAGALRRALRARSPAGGPPRRLPGSLRPAVIALAATATVSLLPGLLGPLQGVLGPTSLDEGVAGAVAPLRVAVLGLGLGLGLLVLAQAAPPARAPQRLTPAAWWASRPPVPRRGPHLPLLVGGVLGSLLGAALGRVFWGASAGVGPLLGLGVVLGALLVARAFRQLPGVRAARATLEW